MSTRHSIQPFTLQPQLSEALPAHNLQRLEQSVNQNKLHNPEPPVRSARGNVYGVQAVIDALQSRERQERMEVADVLEMLGRRKQESASIRTH